MPKTIWERPRAPGTIKNRVSINERPDIVAKKEQIGDWKGDTAIGGGQKGALVILTERASCYTLASILSIKHAESIKEVVPFV